MTKIAFLGLPKIQNILGLHSAKLAIWTPSSIPCENNDDDDSDDNDDDDSDGDDQIIIIKRLNISNAYMYVVEAL